MQGVPARHERGEADGKLQKRVKNVGHAALSTRQRRLGLAISRQSLVARRISALIVDNTAQTGAPG
jgi:hypothetical protein